MDKSLSYRSVWSHLMTVPFKQAYVSAGGLRTRYVEAGDPGSPALVLLHGTGGHWEAFCANIEALSQHFRVIALDMMGCGFTDKPDKPYEIQDYVEHVAAVLDELGVRVSHFIGVSLGAWVCARFALVHPRRTGKLVLVAPTGYFPLSPGVKESVEARRTSAESPTWDNTAAVLRRLYHDPASVIDDIVAVRQRIYSLPGMTAIMPRMLTLFDADARARNNLSDSEWRSIGSPVLLIEHVDTDDVYLRTARKVVGLLPDARLCPIRKTSHWSQFEAPAEFNAAALEFLLERDD
ncbi:alpha/beta fold hydrolase [Piscinibacter sp.]|uniref:alpha/beta fold hydrolase n=1 Tax=Piscinibacter sp. TaxID=1903157 RepID=UPI0039E31735